MSAPTATWDLPPSVNTVHIVVEPDDPGKNSLGIRADAEVVVRGIVQHLTSGGLWGIERDSEHLNVLAREEVDELRDILAALGICLDTPFSEVAWTDGYDEVDGPPEGILPKTAGSALPADAGGPR